MKKQFLLLPLLAIAVISCEKSNNQDVVKQTQLQEIRQNAQSLSHIHDSLLNSLLQAETSQAPLYVSSNPSATGIINFENAFDLIQSVVGVRPYVVNNSDIARMRVGASDDAPLVNLDSEEFRLSDYGRSQITTSYLAEVDELLNDSTLSITQIQEGIAKLQFQIQNDVLANLSDITDFMNGTEILKGSIGIWNGIPASKISLYGGPQYASGLSRWSFWKKLGFVAAADAVGGVLGWFLGGFIVIQGQTVYVPAGPSGVMVSAALLSYMAAKMVGW